MSKSKGFRIVHRPDFRKDFSQTELLDERQSLLARATYNLEADRFHFSSFVELPAHLIQDFIIQSKVLLLPAQKPFRATHNFTLIDRRKNADNAALYERETSIAMIDDLFEFIYGTLLWVPCWSYRWSDQSSQRQTVMDQCGVEEIRHDGAQVFISLLEHWIGLFSCGPEQVASYHSFIPWSDDGSEEGTWYLEDRTPSRSFLQREESLNTLNQLIDLCHRLLELDDNYFIAHGGL